MKNPLKIGHRGAKGYVAENTMASIEKALELKVDAIEIDVHKCASGELVVFHDFTLDRMTNGSGEIAKHLLFDLKLLKVQERFEIPTLKEVLDLVNQKCVINIELKGKNTADEVCNVISTYVHQRGWKSDNFILSSFQHHELESVFNINPNLKLAVLTKANVTDAIEFAKTINAYAIHPNVALVTQDNVKLAQEQGFKVNVWTVNTDDEIARMKHYGVEGIISDVPDRL